MWKHPRSSKETAQMAPIIIIGGNSQTSPLRSWSGSVRRGAFRTRLPVRLVGMRSESSDWSLSAAEVPRVPEKIKSKPWIAHLSLAAEEENLENKSKPWATHPITYCWRLRSFHQMCFITYYYWRLESFPQKKLTT